VDYVAADRDGDTDGDAEPAGAGDTQSVGAGDAESVGVRSLPDSPKHLATSQRRSRGRVWAAGSAGRQVLQPR
jgi:hypothetical protein